MKESNVKKGIGFYLTAAATVLALAGVISYTKVSGTTSSVFILLGAAIVLGSIVFVAVVMGLGHQVLNLLPVVSSVLLIAAVTSAIRPIVQSLALFAVGMNPFSAVQSYVVFAVITGLAWLADIVAAFTGVMK